MTKESRKCFGPNKAEAEKFSGPQTVFVENIVGENLHGRVSLSVERF